MATRQRCQANRIIAAQNISTAWAPRHLRCSCAARLRWVVRPRASLSLPAESGDMGNSDSVNFAKHDQKSLWMSALKPPMYSVGVVPVLVGAAAARFLHGSVCWQQAGCLTLGAVCVIAWLNLSNDAFDAATGVDASKPESLVNLTGSVGGVLLTSKAFLAAGVALLAHVLGTATHGHAAAIMLAAAIACGYVYQGPPFRLSYLGLGEPLCFTAFGLLATPAFFLALSGQQTAAAVPPLVWLAGCLVGVTTSVILFCSHWHQIEGDALAGKRSPLVRIGTARACVVLKAAVAAPYVLAAAGTAVGVVPIVLLPVLALSLPAARALLAFANANHTVPELIAPLKKFGVAWHVAVGAALVVTLALGGSGS